APAVADASNTTCRFATRALAATAVLAGERQQGCFRLVLADVPHDWALLRLGILSCKSSVLDSRRFSDSGFTALIHRAVASFGAASAQPGDDGMIERRLRS
ncbi:MAG: hypothetical protein ABIP94_25505, partial [Planctomycetota bacterium]